jgi:hypothetical protein
VSLIGNTSLLSPQQVVSQTYTSIMNHLKEVISGASTESLNDSSYNVSRYKVLRNILYNTLYTLYNIL